MRWLELGPDGYYHLKEDGQPLPPWEPLFADDAECEIFVRYVLIDLCVRDSPDRWPTKPPLQGIYTKRSGDTKLRGTDRSLRIYVSVTALRKMGKPCKYACSKVEEILREELGRSNRGRRSATPRLRSDNTKIETVRAVYNRFKAPLKQEQLDSHVGFFRRWREWIVNADPRTVELHLDRVHRTFGAHRATELQALITDARRYYEGKDVSWTAAARARIAAYQAAKATRPQKD